MSISVDILMFNSCVKLSCTSECRNSSSQTLQTEINEKKMLPEILLNLELIPKKRHIILNKCEKSVT